MRHFFSVLWSFAVTFISWFALNVCFIVISVFQRHDDGFWVDAPIMLGIGSTVSAVVMFCGWVICFLPLSVIFPPHSKLWRWYVVPFVGAVFGAALLVLAASYADFSPNYQTFMIMGAVGGGFTGLIASWGRHVARE